MSKKDNKKKKEEEEEGRRHRMTNIACSCILAMLSILRRIYDAIVDTAFALAYQRIPTKNLPPVKSQLLLESATSIAEKIRNRQVTCVEVVQTFIDRIREVNVVLNAVVDERFEGALVDAVNADEVISSGVYSVDQLRAEKPLLGVPFTSKESTAASGMSWTFGLIVRLSAKATFDAKIVEGMKNSGAILIAVTNIPELNLWVESRNNVYGQTCNPYNTNRTVGGSSGGEASVVSSCGSPIGLGTDIGGSCRIPAFCCGVYGHKLTGGLINTYGMTFRTGTEKRTIVTAGPITKYAKDIKPIIQAILSPEPEKLTLLSLNSQVDIKKLRYFYVDNPGDRRVSPISEEMKNALRNVVKLISEKPNMDHPPVKAKFTGFQYSYSLWRYWMSKEEMDFPADITNRQGRASVWFELPKKLVGMSDYTLAVILKLIDLKLPLPSEKWAEEETEQLRSALIEKLGNDGVLLFPSSPTVAPYHYAPFFRPYNFAYWCIFNALQFPVTQVPVGLSKDGIPLGIQVVAAPYQDRLCIAVAEEIERLTGGWVSPSPLQTTS